MLPHVTATRYVTPLREGGSLPGLMNAGVLLYCCRLDYLGSRIHLDVDRLRALDPAADPVVVERALRAAADICGGDPVAGPPPREELGRRFRWLTAPRSTVVQPGPVHTGLTTDPYADADRLLRLLVPPVGAPGRPRG